MHETIDMTVEFSNNSVSFFKKITGFETFKNYETNIDQPAHISVCKLFCKSMPNISSTGHGFSKRYSGLCFRIVIEK